MVSVAQPGLARSISRWVVEDQDGSAEGCISSTGDFNAIADHTLKKGFLSSDQHILDEFPGRPVIIFTIPTMLPGVSTIVGIQTTVSNKVLR